MDSNFHSTNPIISGNQKEKVNDIRTCPIIIGAHSIVLKGIKLGHNFIIATGSVVTRSISQIESWSGNPAKFIKN